MLTLMIVGAVFGSAPAAGDFDLTDWSKARERGWIFRDAQVGDHDGRIQVLDGRLSLEDDRDGQLELGGVTAGQLYRLPGPIPFDGPDREFQCHDLLTGRLKWSLPLGTTSTGVVSADVDGDGRHEFVLGTADGRLLALSSALAEAGRILWEAPLPAAAGVPVLCDADGDGSLDIVVSCADGKLHCLSAATSSTAK